jgi:GTP-binding protein HflX
VGWAGYGDREVIVTDTVGFIRSLPKDLFAAFRATFEEAADADLLVHVVDASDPSRDEHIATTEQVLSELELAEIPRIVVFNKTDLIEAPERNALARGHHDAILLSATHRDTTRALIERIASALAERWDESAALPVSAIAEDDATTDDAEA